ncbi:flagellar basal body L-ring protein FlgH [Pseudaquidulcibacter saccharophilus]|uniref:flagellar basal body L-ring protein FlgH n=1 Tax=Pseudaquidulcibacter saccharophilus TaxID=2831900 RepID=UPI001EFF3458|nr:flagellar basal body L-ring protein FlgH [Pseudaquidulcibacter saccharophilus]
MNNAFKLIVIASLSLLATGCASTVDEIKNAGKPPALTPIQDPQMAAAGRRQVVMPMPDATDNRTSSNSLWRAGAKQFFADPRASKIGDILTVNVTINDNAQMNNTTTGKESSTKSGGVSNFFGLEKLPGKILPSGYDPANMIGTSSAGAFSGSGVVNRQEKMSLTVAALVTQVLPNGNLVVAGRQEVRVNNEIRELLVSGIVRPQDISSANTVLHTQMAEARISYGGRGQLSKYNKQPVGQQILETISPF